MPLDPLGGAAWGLSLAASTASTAGRAAGVGRSIMATFVLVHGADHGGWCWRRVVPLLRAAGHEVYAPTLTGLGERAHLAHPGIDLETHIQDVLGVIEYEDLDRVVLVGHGYAGTVV